MNLSRLLAIILSALLLSCSNIQNDIPIIDVFSNSVDTIEVKVSEITEKVEYLQLNFPLEMINAGSRTCKVIVGEKIIVCLISNLERSFVFDKKGKFIHAFDISYDNANPIKSYYSINWDMSPKEDKIVIERLGKLLLYDINGYLLGECQVPFTNSGFYFLDNDKVAVLKSRKRMESDGNILFIYNDKLELTDSLFWVKTPGPMPENNGRRSYLPSDKLFKSQNTHYLKLFDNDTLFKVTPELSTTGVIVMNFGDFKRELKWYESSSSLSNTAEITSFYESTDYLIFDIDGPYTENWEDYKVSSILVNKIDGRYFVATHPLSNSNYYSLIDDIDGFSSSFGTINTNYSFLLNPSYCNYYFERDTSIISQVSDKKYISEIKSLSDNSDNYTLILRTAYYSTANARSTRKIRFKPKYPDYDNLTKFLPVKTNHEWEEAQALSDITYDPTDDSFWLVKMKMRGADTIEHRNRNGMIIPGSFVTDKNIECEAITVSTIDSTLWLSDNRFSNNLYGLSIIHFDRQGNDLGDGFDIKDIPGIYSMTFDPSDGTLWLIEGLKNLLWHYSTTGERIGDSINLMSIGCNDIRSMCYDIRDNTLWLLNKSPHKIIHIDKEGKPIPGTFYFNPFIIFPDGVALDYKNYEFWVGDWIRKRPY